ncbi:P-loop containing nucleoside triphosphate hydrolase protein [Dothidotthia symphoricarpi CBS 119687]|uniref:P-loop containing nucleoside triphosphate hydrolase protein n=1 Tax=Dothidotthia symphoricarpi CBS 119687 TaxID=1392245 RepID=A0A6A6A913_9PLEO|nr:P-loop containing nucleoside triphosphate hydrolase protein [Dothidotthia symphoricarpi CBS 119687]KAF2127327.1 P-loop containing nucleoside triphosphate hydrolase protein [Dothidotthia symphoricarpi CBS 119687]
MEEQIVRLVDRTWDKFQDVPASKRLLIAVSGIPGSGKTTLAATVSNRLNKKHVQQSPGTSNSSPLAAFIPMDGYHLSRVQLDAMPDPANAHARRGAAFTFDGESYLRLVKNLRESILPETKTLHAPSFDHAVKDPVEDDIAIAPSVRIVIFEGNYCSLNSAPWKDAAKLMDELWFVDVDFKVARKRLVYRHVKAGIAKNEEEAGKRADENDLVNGQEIVDNRLDVHELIKSHEDAYWAPEEQGVGDGKDSGTSKEMAEAA